VNVVARSVTDRWKKAPLAGHLQSGEELVAAIQAFTGLLGHPFVAHAPLIGSTRWDLALTTRRIVAIQRLLIPALHHARKVESISLSEIDAVSTHTLTSLSANVAIKHKAGRREFRIFGFPADVHTFLKEMSRAWPIADSPEVAR
jgi:hypothetical protein